MHNVWSLKNAEHVLTYVENRMHTVKEDAYS